jgi:hypothetical protein
MDIEALVKEYRGNLAATAMSVKEYAGFDLETPCALIADGTVTRTTLLGLRRHLPCSAALASEAIQRFVLLRSEHGFDRAFELCSSDDPDGNGEEFVRAWDEAQKDLERGVVVTVNDLVAMVEQARRGWAKVQRRMLVVARSGDKVTSGTVSVDWVLAG